MRFHSHSVLGPSPNSVLSGASAHAEAVNNLPSDWLIYEEMTRIHRTANVRCCTLVSPITVAIFAGPAKLPAEAIKEVDSAQEGGCCLQQRHLILTVCIGRAEGEMRSRFPKQCSFRFICQCHIPAYLSVELLPVSTYLVALH